MGLSGSGKQLFASPNIYAAMLWAVRFVATIVEANIVVHDFS